MLKNKIVRSFINLINNNKKLFIIALLFVILFLTYWTTRTILYNIEKREAEQLPEISYEIKNLTEDKKSANVVVTFAKDIGLDTIKLKSAAYKSRPIAVDDNIVYAHGKMKVAVDYKMQDMTTYNFLVKYKNGQEKTLTLEFEINRRKGVYSKVNGLYVNEPDLEGYNQLTTRYVYSNASGNLIPGNWINGDKPSSWYDYKTRKWANIYAESEGVEGYYIWIPRYCYKLNNETQRVDIKFINTYDQYIDGTTNEITEWETLEAQGYIIPEAFYWGNIIIPGYWMSKYQLSDKTAYKLDFSGSPNKTSLTVNAYPINISPSKYTYAVNGVVKSTTTSTSYTFTNLPEGDKVINITALDANGVILASITKTISLADPNPPDLSGFDPYTTFYVYWDDNGIEHNETPISKDPPEDWYNYSAREWANIMTRTDNMEAYFIWIPRYQYYINTELTNIQAPNQRVQIKFIKGTSTQTDQNYIIPEAFTWGDENSSKVQLTGYWMAKYQLSDKQATPRVRANITAGNNVIRIGVISGTVIDNNSGNLKFEYWKDGVKVHEGTNVNENYAFTGLSEETTYGITIIVRNKTTNAYLGGETKKIATIAVNKPDLTGFNTNVTYYVTYNSSGNPVIGDKIKNDGSNAPVNWYDYSDRKWANIVTTDGTVSNGTITGGTYKSYFLWIPRYEYQLDTTTQRVRIKFLKGKSTTVDTGYTIPEAFIWGDGSNNKQLTGYWMSKYQLSN